MPNKCQENIKRGGFIMTAIEYLEQAKKIDAKIKLGLRELTYWTELENSLRKNDITEDLDYDVENPTEYLEDE